jgi:hypothetical protein
VPIWKKEFASSGAVWIEGSQAREAADSAEPQISTGPVETGPS